MKPLISLCSRSAFVPLVSVTRPLQKPPFISFYYSWWWKYFSQPAKMELWLNMFAWSNFPPCTQSLVQRFWRHEEKGFVPKLTSSVMLRGRWLDANKASWPWRLGDVDDDVLTKAVPLTQTLREQHWFNSILKICPQSLPEWVFCVLITGTPDLGAFALCSSNLTCKTDVNKAFGIWELQ